MKNGFCGVLGGGLFVCLRFQRPENTKASWAWNCLKTDVNTVTNNISLMILLKKNIHRPIILNNDDQMTNVD